MCICDMCREGGHKNLFRTKFGHYFKKMFGSHWTEVKTVGIKNEKEGRGVFFFFFKLQGDSILEEGGMREGMIQHEERVMSGTS